MTFMYFVTSTVLAIGTFVVSYRGTKLRDYSSGLTVLVGMGTFLAAQFVRVLLMGLLMVQPEQTFEQQDEPLDWVRMIIVAAISFVEAAALYLATTKVASNRSIGSLAPRVRASAIAYGYALAETILLRIPFFWIHARSVDWDVSSLCVALEAGASLARYWGVSNLALVFMQDKSASSGSSRVIVIAAIAASLVAPELAHTLLAFFLGGNPLIECGIHALVGICTLYTAEKVFPASY